jgi:poly-gamma-glutamate capsule biosynthesis protein CapA/YwtB (metallophosphatase superfamily)
VLTAKVSPAEIERHALPDHIRDSRYPVTYSRLALAAGAPNRMSSPAASGKFLRLFLCGDVRTGRGIDQVLPHPVNPGLHERGMHSAIDYVRLASRASGAIPAPVDAHYLWGDALKEWRRSAPDVRIVNLETSITRSDAFVPKGINYRMSPENAICLTAAEIDCCVLANNHVLDSGL